MEENKISSNNSQTKIAVVIPVYNCERYLKEAVDSVLCQPYKYLDLVLVDDGSTDGSARICDELALQTERITVFHQKNAGVSAARNIGIEHMLKRDDKPSYIAFLDADDGWTADFFDENIQALLQKGYDLIGFQSCDCDAALNVYKGPEDMEQGVHVGGQDNVWLHSKQSFAAMLYSSSFLADNGIRFFEELKYSEDKTFSMQCMYLANTICLWNKVLYLYRHNGRSAMNSRVHGIPYFTPIIDGYLKLDSLIREKRADTSFTISRTMASIYIMDMIKEHYQMQRKKGDVKNLLKRRQDYVAIVTGTGKYADIKPNEDYAYYRKHPAVYIMRNNWKGVIKLCRKIARKAHLLKS